MIAHLRDGLGRIFFEWQADTPRELALLIAGCVLVGDQDDLDYFDGDRLIWNPPKRLGWWS